jgi:hypothetical protein
VLATVGLQRLWKLPQVQTIHQMPSADADAVKSVFELGDYRGKTWRLAYVRYASDAPYEGTAAVAYIRELAAACFPYPVLVSLSGNVCAALVLVHFEDKYRKNIDLATHCTEIRWLYPKTTARGGNLLSMASVVQNAGRSIGGTLHVTNDTISSGAAAEYTMRQLYEHFRSFTREQFNAFVGDAKLHKAAKSASPLDVAVLTVQAELRTYVSDMTEATSTLLKVDGDKIAMFSLIFCRALTS